MIRTIHRAKYVLAESDLLLQNAAVHVCDPGRICRVEPWQDSPRGLQAEVQDWGAAVIIPGLVNAHTHLELTGMHKQLSGLSSFTQWLSQLVQLRRDWTEEDFARSVGQGAAAVLQSGTTLVGDVSASGVSAKALAGKKLRRVVFEETLGLAPTGASLALAALETRLKSVPPESLFTPGVSPHAPYSVSPDLYRSISELARAKSMPLATHLAETRSEIQFLQSGGGELRDFLSRLQVLPEGWSPPGLHPVQYLENLSVLERSPLLIHCNYLDENAISRILGNRCSVVYCPRSHAFFGHEPHPVRKLLDAGVNVALGTDSLASNESLSMLDEIRFLYRTRTDLKVDEIMRMATLNGAAALGFGGVLGRIRRGSWADISVLELPETINPKHLLAQILEGAGKCSATIVCGEIAWRKNPVAEQRISKQ